MNAPMMWQGSRTTFKADGQKIPHEFKKPKDGGQYSQAFSLVEKISIPNPMDIFMPASLNLYHTKGCNIISTQTENFIKQICAAICQGVENWAKAAVVMNVKINGPVAAAGSIKGPPMMPLIMASAPKATAQETKYSKAVAKAVGDAWDKWSKDAKIPGLPLYPAFAAFPGPVAPPMPNIPIPLILMQSSSEAEMSSKKLADAMKKNLGDSKALHQKTLFKALGTGVNATFMAFKAATLVTNIMGFGNIPSFAPPVAPVGPVVNGQGTSTPGGLVVMPSMAAMLQKMSAEVQKQAEMNWKKAAAMAQKGADVAMKAHSALMDAADKAIAEAKKNADKAAAQVTAQAEAAANKARKAAQDAVKKVQEQAEAAAKDAEKAAKKAIDEARKKADDAADRVKKAAEEETKKVAAQVAKVNKKAAEKLEEEARKKIKETNDKAKKAIDTTADNANAQVDKASGLAKDSIDKTADKAKDKINEVAPKTYAADDGEEPLPETLHYPGSDKTVKIGNSVAKDSALDINFVRAKPARPSFWAQEMAHKKFAHWGEGDKYYDCVDFPARADWYSPPSECKVTFIGTKPQCAGFIQFTLPDGNRLEFMHFDTFTDAVWNAHKNGTPLPAGTHVGGTMRPAGLNTAAHLHIQGRTKSGGRVARTTWRKWLFGGK